MDALEEWSDAYDRVLLMVRSLDEDKARRTVPATPEWTVHDLLAHMVGVDADALSGDVPDDLSPTWTGHHVSERSGKSVHDITDEWIAMSPRVKELIADDGGEAAANLVLDVSVHEQDLRGALEEPGARQTEAIVLGLDTFGGAFAERVKTYGAPTLRIETEGWAFTAGDGDPETTVRADRYEVYRALTGRRSAAQVESWDWHGDAKPYLPIFSMFGDLRDGDLKE